MNAAGRGHTKGVHETFSGTRAGLMDMQLSNTRALSLVC